MVGKKHSSKNLKDFTDLDFFFCFYFFHFLCQMPVYLVVYAKRMLCSEQPTALLARRHLNTMLLTNFENFNSISNIFRETHGFLVLTDTAIICIYIRTVFVTGDWRPPAHLKVTKCDLVQILKTFWNPSLRIFTAGKASLVDIVLMYIILNDIN